MTHTHPLNKNVKTHLYLSPFEVKVGLDLLSQGNKVDGYNKLYEVAYYAIDPECNLHEFQIDNQFHLIVDLTTTLETMPDEFKENKVGLQDMLTKLHELIVARESAMRIDRSTIKSRIAYNDWTGTPGSVKAA